MNKEWPDLNKNIQAKFDEKTCMNPYVDRFLNQFSDSDMHFNINNSFL